MTSSADDPHSQNTIIGEDKSNENNEELPSQFKGKYRLESSENFDAFLREIGVGFIGRKLGALASPDLYIYNDKEGYICTKVVAPFKTLINRFRFNEIYHETRMDGTVCKSKMEFVPPNKFVQHQWDNQLEIKYIREFVDDKINVTSICNNVQSFRVYRRIESIDETNAQ